MKFPDLADLWSVWSMPKERSFGSGEPAPKARKLGDFSIFFLNFWYRISDRFLLRYGSQEAIKPL